jgi:hypothetical protein
LLSSAASAQERRDPVPARSVADLANPTRPFSGDADTARAAAALDDTDPLTRQVALEAIAARLALARFQRGPDAPLATSAERLAFQTLRAQVVASLADADEAVRLAAVRALGLLGLSGTGRAPVVDRATLEVFVAAFPAEPADAVRAEMLRIITHTPPAEPAAALPLLLAGLDSGVPSLMAPALRGLGAQRVSSVLARVVALLDHADRDVRLAATQAVREYGAAARPHLAALRRVRDTDSDPATQQATAALVQAIEAAR